jgi:hypothetical protein
MNHCGSDSGDDDFFPSDRSEMPPTREPSPEPFSETAKRYGWSADHLLPLQKMLPIPQGQLPLMEYSPYLSSSIVQNNALQKGLSLDYLAKFDSPDRRVKTDGDSEVYNIMGSASTATSVSQEAFDEMQRVSMKLNRATTWFRVVHRGYGQAPWLKELESSNLAFVHGPFASEGDYVMIPEGLGVDKIVEILTKVNLTVRKIVWFREMKRSNKSRVLFKWEPFTVSPTGFLKPTLVETKTFSCQD